MRTALDAHLAGVERTGDGQLFPAVFRQLESLSVGYVIEALRQLGMRFEVGERLASESLATQVGVIDSHRRLFARLLEMLAEEKLLQKIAGGWQVIAQPAATNLRPQLARPRPHRTPAGNPADGLPEPDPLIDALADSTYIQEYLTRPKKKFNKP